MTDLGNLLLKYRSEFSKILPFDIKEKELHRLDLSVDNPELKKIKLFDNTALKNYIKITLNKTNKKLAFGGYAEDRAIYRQSSHFGENENARTIHLGIDIWCDKGTHVLSPLEGIVHSFNNNDNFKDYGPTVILQHKLEDIVFYTLYGHLTKKSLLDIQTGHIVNRGEKIGEVGTEHENGGWLPHLHFQVIRDLLENKGDFPGVASGKELKMYLNLCPNPENMLKFS